MGWSNLNVASEADEGVSESQELSDTLQTVWNRPALDVYNLLRITLQSTSTNNMAQKRN